VDARDADLIAVDGGTMWNEYGLLKKQIVFAGGETDTFEERDTYRAVGMALINKINPTELHR
jgi:hypothetical protein